MKTALALVCGCALIALTVLLSETPARGQSPASAKPAPAPATAAPAMPALASRALPVYPSAAQSARVQGVVELQGTIGADGRVSGLSTARSIPQLDQAAMDAVRQWQFDAPASAMPVTIRVHFALSPIERLVDPKQPATVEPARATPNRAQWLPADFAFMYVYDCRNGQRQVDSTRAQVLDLRGDKSGVRSLQLTRELEEQLYLGMIGRGVFGTPSVTTLREPKPGVTIADDGIDVTVVGEVTRTNTQSIAQQISAASSGKSGRAARPKRGHELSVRQFGQWRQVTWGEPVRKKDQEATDRAAIGAMIREMVSKDAADKSREYECR
jgi:TonB family protein